MAHPRIVAIGGGSGPSLIARSIGSWFDASPAPARLARPLGRVGRERSAGPVGHFTAVVATTDSGSSTGAIREQFGLPAPGDLRAAISTLARLADPSSPWPEVLEQRLRPLHDGPLANMAFGNVLLTALAQRTGGFGAAVRRACEMVGAVGTVVPVCEQPVHLVAWLADGSIVHGEVAVRTPGKPPITRVGVDAPDARAYPPAVEAIERADYLFVGPGNLFTSIAACLAVPGIPDAVRRCRGTRIYVPNTTSYPGQTDRYSVLDHVTTVVRCLGPGAVDYVLVNCEEPLPEVRLAYSALGVEFLRVDMDEVRALVDAGISVASAPLLEPSVVRPRNLHKLDTIRHDPTKVGRVLAGLFGVGARGLPRRLRDAA